MELDDLKYKNRGQLPTRYDKQMEELRLLLKRKSHFIMDRVNSNLNQEIVMLLMAFALFVFMTFMERGGQDMFWFYYGIFFTAYSIIGALVTVLLKSKIEKLFNSSDEPIKSRLGQIYHALRAYLRNSNMISIVGTFILAIIFFHRVYHHADLALVAGDLPVIVRILIASLFPLLIVGVGFVARSAYTKWYNKRLAEIEEHLQELQELEML